MQCQGQDPSWSKPKCKCWNAAPHSFYAHGLWAAWPLWKARIPGKLDMVRVRSKYFCVHMLHKYNHGTVGRGVRREVLKGGGGGSPAGSLGGAVSPPAGSGAPEDFEINTFQRLRTPVSLSFLFHRVMQKLHAVFFIHSHPHHFQLNEVVPNHKL